jgi:hypothetical protein
MSKVRLNHPNRCFLKDYRECELWKGSRFWRSLTLMHYFYFHHDQTHCYICSICNNAISNSGYLGQSDWMVLYNKSRTYSYKWHNSRYYFVMWLEGLRKTTKYLSQDSRCLRRDTDVSKGLYYFQFSILNLKKMKSFTRLYLMCLKQETMKSQTRQSTR